MRIRTAVSLLSFTAAAREAGHSAGARLRFPFAGLHDSEDRVVLARGARALVAAAEAAGARAEWREWHELPGGKHDLTTNRADELASICCKWVQQRLCEGVDGGDDGGAVAAAADSNRL